MRRDRQGARIAFPNRDYFGSGSGANARQRTKERHAKLTLL